MASAFLPLSSSFSSSSSPPESPSTITTALPREYYVFLSFSGQDVQTSFIDDLDAALHEKGIFTFRDDRELERGTTILGAIQKAIKQSQSSIVVFSENYAASAWCLDEMVMIHERMKQESSYKVFPVFYHVDQTDVRELRGSYGEAFSRHELEFRNDILKVLKWKVATIEAAQVSGWDLKNKLEFDFIQDIVQEILSHLSHPNGITVAGTFDMTGIGGERQDVIFGNPETEKTSNLIKCEDISNFLWYAMGFVVLTVFSIAFVSAVSAIFRDQFPHSVGSVGDNCKSKIILGQGKSRKILCTHQNTDQGIFGEIIKNVL